MQISGSNVIVTGGASGIGRGMSERFAALGAAHVIVADLDQAAAQAVASGIGGTAVAVDVTDDSSVRSLVTTGLDTMGHVDLFCANAGIGQGGALDTDDAMWERSFQVNVMGVVRSARAVIPHMTERGGGNFLVTASAAGLFTGPVSFNYATSKHAAIGVAEWLAIHHPTITVSALCPTVVDTPMLPEFGETIVEPLTVDQVIDATVDGLETGEFLITPTPDTAAMFQAKAADWNGFFDGLRSRLAGVGKVFGT